jgi:general secretion pathway protein F
MPEFAYRGIDLAGDQKQGHVSAANENEARARLEQRKLYILDLGESVSGPAPQALLTRDRFDLRSRRLSVTMLSLFTRQLATLVQVSPVGDSLSTIARQTEKARARAVIANVQTGVIEGQRISDAMAREPKSFPPIYRAIVAAGDASGTLSTVLERLANLLERRAAMRAKITTALAYPAILALVAIFVVAALMIFVVPKMVEQFDNVGQQLPLLTRVIIGTSTFLTHYWPVILGALIITAFLFWQALLHEKTRAKIDFILLGLPIFGKILRDVNAASFARNLSTMVAARLPLVEGLALVRDTVGNHVLSTATSRVIEHVRAGGSLSGAMQETGYFPPLLTYLTASGESSGRLDLMLERAAEYLEREFDHKSAVTLALLEPAVIVIMGIMVALIVLSVLLPILQLESLARL